MPRSGQNPMRWISELTPPAPLSMTTMVHIPDLSGYWAESLEVLELCLDSLRETTPEPFELLVLDNGSCAAVRKRLEERFAAREIDQLLLSRHNLGKVGGWNLLFAAARGERIAYCDSDVYFLPGWFEATRAICEAFPEAAMVTAQPIPGDLSLHCEATLQDARADATVAWREGDDLIPERFLTSHRLGLGDSEELYRARLAKRREVLLRRGATEAYVSASHFQFVSPREILRSFLPMPTHIPLGDDAEFDARLDEAGHWRLSTTDYLVHHMGNRRPDLARELPWRESGVPEAAPGTKPPSEPRAAVSSALKRRLQESPRVRRLLKALHRKTFELLYFEEPGSS